jgi:hypothetical protein
MKHQTHRSEEALVAVAEFQGMPLSLVLADAMLGGLDCPDCGGGGGVGRGGGGGHMGVVVVGSGSDCDSAGATGSGASAAIESGGGSGDVGAASAVAGCLLCGRKVRATLCGL